jgi:hypothetical protein
MNWVEIDTLGMPGQRFSGSEAALRTHLLGRVGTAGRITSTMEEVYVAERIAKVRRTVVTLTAPWGRWRYVADPW